MAKIGLSLPYFAVYSASGSTVTYSSGGKIGKYTEMSMSLDNGTDNVLYADNAPAESDKTFAGGSFTMSTSDLDASTMKAILGTTEESITATGLTGAKWEVFDDNQAIPYLGVGGVIKKRVGGVDKYVAFVLDKVQFDNPSIEAVTQGETVEWGTQELTATIMRSDATDHPWRRISNELDSEADAETCVKDFLDIT